MGDNIYLCPNCAKRFVDSEGVQVKKEYHRLHYDSQVESYICSNCNTQYSKEYAKDAAAVLGEIQGRNVYVMPQGGGI